MAFLAIGAALGFTGIAAAAIDFGVTLAVSVGLSYAAQALAGKPAATTADTPSFSTQGQLSFGGTVARCALLGYCATAGSLVYANTWGTSDDGKSPNAYITQVIALSDIPISGLSGVWVNGAQCTMGSFDSEKGYAVTQYNKSGKDYLWVKFYDGTQTSADSLCINKVTSTERPYQSTRVGTGVAYAVCTALIEDTLYTGVPQFRFELQGAKLYDITKDSTAGGSGTHVWSDPSTWGGDGDNLPAVQIYNIIRGINYGGKWFYGLQNVTGARLPYVSWSQAINKCRTTVTGVSGTEPQYRTGGQVNVNAQVADTVQAMLTGCQGRLSEVGGAYKLHVGEPDSATASFTDDDILSTEQQSFSPFFGLSASVNGISGSYPEQAEGWASKPAPDLYNSAFETEDGDRRLMAAVQYDFVPYSEQVQRLMKSALNEARRARQHTIVLPPGYWPVEPGDFVSWTSARNGYDNKLFRVDGTTDKANLDVVLVLTEVDPTDYDWNHGDYQPPTTGQVGVIRVPAQGVLAWAATGYTLIDKDGFTRRPAVQLSWDGDVPGIVGVQYELAHQNPGDSTWTTIDRNRTDQVAAGAVIIWNGLLPNEPYQVRGQYIPNAPRDMLWSDWIDVTTPDVRTSLADFDAALKAQVTKIQDQLQDQLNDITQQIAAISSNQDARNWLDKKEVRSQLYAQAGNAKADIATLQQVMVDEQTAFANYQSEVSATFGPAFSSVSSVSSAVATINGYAAAQYSVTLNVNGYATGFNLLNGGAGTSSFTVVSDKFQIQLPGYHGNAPLSVFTIGTLNGSPSIGVSGNLYLDGSITAKSLSVGTLSAITANLGSITAGVMQSPNGKYLIDLNNEYELISD